MKLKLASLLKYVFCPAWRRNYKLNKLVHRGRDIQDSMIRLGIIEH